MECCRRGRNKLGKHLDDHGRTEQEREKQQHAEEKEAATAESQGASPVVRWRV